MRVLTLNVLGMKLDWVVREGRVAGLIREVDADVVCLQEVASLSRDGASQAGRLADRSGLGYEAVYRGARNYVRLLRTVWLGNAVLAKGKITAREGRQLPRGPEDQTYPRAAVGVRVEVAPGVEVDVVSTHLHHRGGPDGDGIRLEQGRDLLSWLGRPRRPRLLAGDLNDDPGSPVVRRLKSAFTDGWAAAESKSGPKDGATTTKSGRRIDYVLADPGPGGSLRVLSARTVGPNDGNGDMISDHRGVVVELELTLPRE